MEKVFSFEQRLEAIRLWQEEKVSPASIAKQYGTCHSVVERWIRIYKWHGLEGLRIKPYNLQYDEAFKRKVVDEMLENKQTGSQLAAKYEISHSTLNRWFLDYTKGVKMNGKRNIISAEEAALLREKYKHTKDPALKAALERNEYLEMENEVLKKLKTLAQARQEKKRG